MFFLAFSQLVDYNIHIGHSFSNSFFFSTWMLFGYFKETWIINLLKTFSNLKTSFRVLSSFAANFQPVWFVHLEKAIDISLKCAADACGELSFASTWVSGFLTNFFQISNSIFNNKKKGISQSKLVSKLKLNTAFLLSSRFTWPRAIFSSSVYCSSLALVESLNSSILSIGVTDTNAQVLEVAFPIPGNDDFLNSILFFNTLISSVILRYKFRYILLWYSIFYSDKNKQEEIFKKEKHIPEIFITKKAFRKNYKKTSASYFSLTFEKNLLKIENEFQAEKRFQEFLPAEEERQKEEFKTKLKKFKKKIAWELKKGRIVKEEIKKELNQDYSKIGLKELKSKFLILEKEFNALNLKEEIKKGIRKFSLITAFFSFRKPSTFNTLPGQVKIRITDQSKLNLWGKFFTNTIFQEDLGSTFFSSWISAIKIRHFLPMTINEEREDSLSYNPNFFFLQLPLFSDFVPKGLKEVIFSERPVFSNVSPLKWWSEKKYEKVRLKLSSVGTNALLTKAKKLQKFPFYTVLEKISKNIVRERMKEDYSKLSFFHKFSESKSYSYRFLYSLFEENKFLRTSFGLSPKAKKKTTIEKVNQYVKSINSFYNEKTSKIFEVCQRLTEESIYFKSINKGILSKLKDWDFEKLKMYIVYLSDLPTLMYEEALRSGSQPPSLLKREKRFSISLLSLLKKREEMLSCYHLIQQANEMRKVNIDKKYLTETFEERISSGGFLIDELFKKNKNLLYRFSWFNKKRKKVLTTIRKASKKLLAYFFSKRLATLRSFIFNSLLRFGWKFKMRIKKSSYLTEIHPFFEEKLKTEAALWLAFASYDISNSWNSEFKTLSYIDDGQE